MGELAPEGFDLEAALHQQTTTPPEEWERCPDCRSTNIRKKKGGAPGDPHRKDGTYRCADCAHHFDEPVQGGRDD